METLKEVYLYIEKISNTHSSNGKVELVKKGSAYPIFKKVLEYALDSRLTYSVKKFPTTTRYSGKNNDQQIFEYLTYLADKEGTSAMEKKKLYALAMTDPETYELVKRICNKDLKCGIGVKFVNKAIPNFIFYIPYCRCSTDKQIHKIIYPALIQEKEDGMFANVFIDNTEETKILSRNGKELLQMEEFKRVIDLDVKPEYNNIVLQGELRIYEKDGTLMPREKSNGIFTSCQYGTANQSDVDRAVLFIWCIVPLRVFWGKEKPRASTYSIIFDFCRDVASLCSRVETVKCEFVDSYEEAWQFYLNRRAEGGEGAVLKNRKFSWKDGTSTDQIKLKNVSEADLILVGWNYADEDSKYKGMMGALLFESKCGKLKVKVGTGFSDSDRVKDWDAELNTVHEIEYESVSKSQANEYYSLRLPRYNGPKPDRTIETADTLKDLLKR